MPDENQLLDPAPPAPNPAPADPAPNQAPADPPPAATPNPAPPGPTPVADLPAAPVAPTSPGGTVDPIAAPPTPAQGVQMPPPTAPQTSYAGFWIRFLAALIDGIILYGAIFLGGSLVGGLTFGKVNINNPLGAVVLLLLVLAALAYAPFMLAKFGATLGKMIVHLRVVDGAGNKPTVGQALLRELIGKWVSGLVFDLGYLWVAFDEKKQGWHDKIAGTFVVKIK